jgi:hypothetical protein
MNFLNLPLARLASSITYIKFTSKCKPMFTSILLFLINIYMCVIGSSIPKNKKKMHHDYAIKSYEHFYFCFQILMLVK